jgi:uncharacterized protein (DUF433 family)
MATAAKVVYSHITKQPGVRGGKACVDDTRIAVVDVVALVKQGLADQRIVERYPSLNLAQVHAAISYYYDNRNELDADLAEDDDAEPEHERRKARVPEPPDSVVVRRPVYTDADLHGPIVAGLINRGFDVIRAVDAAPEGTDGG